MKQCMLTLNLLFVVTIDNCQFGIQVSSDFCFIKYMQICVCITKVSSSN